MCNACQNRDVHNVGQYAHDRLIGDRTWTGTLDDMIVGDFIQRIGGDVMSTYETAVVENIAIKYYLEMSINFSTDNTRWKCPKHIGQVFHTDNNLRCGELGH